MLLLMYFSQDRLLYGRKREHLEDPTKYGMKFEDVHVITPDDIRLHGYFITQDKEACSVPTIILLVGQGSNAGYELGRCSELYMCGYNVMVVSYRGSGQSGGKPTEQGIMLDAKSTVLYAYGSNDSIDTGLLFLFGVSLGGAVAISILGGDGDIAKCLKGVIVENTFTSMNELFLSLGSRSRVLKWLTRLGFLKRMNKNRWSSIERVAKVEIPMLFLSGLKDDVVPPSHMQRLYNEASSSSCKEIRTFADGDHIDTWKHGGAEYRQALKGFVETKIP